MPCASTTISSQKAAASASTTTRLIASGDEMPVARYLVAILDAFIKWWWAAITGVASVLGWMMVPSDGVTLGRLAVSILVFFGLLLVFLVASVLVKAYPWYAGAVEQPRVIEFVPRGHAAGADEPVCTFVIQ